MGTGKDFIDSAVSHQGGQPAPRRAAVRSPVSAPNYTGLKIVGWLCIICGFLSFLFGAIWILIVLTTAVISGGAAARDEPSAAGALVVAGGLYSIITAIAVFLGGIVQIAFGQLLLAIRDMARNSFWLRRM